MAAFSFLHSSSRARRREAEENLRRWGPWIVFGLVLLALCLGWLLLPLREWMDALQNWLRGRGASGVVIFAAILIVMTFLPAPDWPLPIAAGYVYGVWAFPLTYGCIALASTLAFLAARHLARDRIRGFLARRRKYRAVDRAVAKEGWQVVVLLRLSPIVPFNLQNYALGVTAIPFWQYLGATLVGIVPGLVIYIYFGMFGKGVAKGVGPVDWALFGAGALATVALGVLVTRKTKAKFAENDRPKRRK
jgi:uncharacterized membrane protein YdjX (TVP38/TMEM64 family)